MTFNSLQFLIFLAVVVIGYYIVPPKLKNIVLLAASYFFYASYNVGLLLFLILCTIVSYCIARQMEKAQEQNKKKWLKTGIALNVGVLAFYKYLNFLLEMLMGNHFDVSDQINLIVPLGISFIIFTCISYLVDVYRGTVHAEQRVLSFALYIAFFPKIVQGPIVKASDLIPQFDAEHKFSWFNFQKGSLFVLYGLFMKMVVADRASVIVNAVYAKPEAYTGAAAVLATILFAVQIYFDFAGYSLTAIGAANMLGFSMKDNFRQPYLSSSIGEFWRRWHISLNRWLTDYVYIPLGGSRCSAFRRDMNTLITFGISGLWHGADWGYVVWGLLNGVYIVAEKRFHSIAKKKKDKKFSVVGMLLTFCLICFSWIFFRAQDLASSLAVIRQIVFHFDIGVFWEGLITELHAETPAFMGVTVHSWMILLVSLLVGAVVDIAEQKICVAEKIINSKTYLRWTVYLLLIFGIIIFGMYGYGYSAGAFIYAQF